MNAKVKRSLDKLSVYKDPTNIYMNFINYFSHYLSKNYNYDQKIDKLKIIELGNSIWRFCY